VFLLLNTEEQNQVLLVSGTCLNQRIQELAAQDEVILNSSFIVVLLDVASVHNFLSLG